MPAVRIALHHRLMLSLRHLVLTQVKALVRDVMLVLPIGLSASVVGLPIVKVPAGQIISIATVAFKSTERVPVTVTVRVVVAVLPPPSCTI